MRVEKYPIGECEGIEAEIRPTFALKEHVANLAKVSGDAWSLAIG